MKSKIKRHSRSALAVILTLSMLVSCMMVGLIATDAAKVTDNSETVGASVDNVSVGWAEGGYVKGAWDSWATPDASKGHWIGGDGYTVTLAANKTYEFCFVASDNSDVFKKDQTITTSVTAHDFTKSATSNAKLKTTIAGDYTFKWSSYTNDSMRVNITFPSAPSEPDTWTVVGGKSSTGSESDPIFGLTWDPTLTQNDMTESSGTYTWTKSNVTLTEARAILYKVAKNHAWDTVVPSGDNKSTITLDGVSCNTSTNPVPAGIYNVEVTFNGSSDPTLALTTVTQSTLTVAGNADATITATYNGTTASNDGTTPATISNIPEGATVSIDVVPNTGFMCDGITCTPSATTRGSYNSYTMTMPGADTTVEANITAVTLKKIFFNNNYTQYGTIYAYVYDKDDDNKTYEYLGARPGKVMIETDNTEMWYIEVPSDVDYVEFISGDGKTTGELTIPWNNANPKYTAPYNYDAPTTANGGTWGNYIWGDKVGDARDNVYTVSDGSTMTASNLFTGINATLYDYYTNGEIAASAGTDSDTGASGAPNGWLKGIASNEYDPGTSGNLWLPYEDLNGALIGYADTTSQPKYDVTYPLYFGNLNYATKSGYYNYSQKANNSVPLTYSSNAVTGLSGKTLANGSIHYYDADDTTNENGAPMAMFNEDFLSGENSKGKPLATILRTSTFPVRTTTSAAGYHKIYFDASSVSWWNNGNVTTKAHFWDSTNTSDTLDVVMTQDQTNNFIYSTDRVDSKYNKVIFYRGSWNNQTDDLDVPAVTDANLCYKLNGNYHGDNNKYCNGSWTTNSDAVYYNASHVYYEFDSTNGKDNAYITDINKSDKTAKINYYYDSYKTKTGAGAGDPYGFFPFDYNTYQNNANNSSNIAHDLGFGMKLEIPFTLEANGKFSNNDPQEFNFSGDDDLWVFVDGKLVLDLGGAHGRTTGTINFNTKKITYTMTESIGSATRNDDFTWFDNTNPNYVHTMTIYYMERGMFDSNLKFGFSFHAIPNQFWIDKKIRTKDRYNLGYDTLNGGFFTPNGQTDSNMTTHTLGDTTTNMTKFEKSFQDEEFEVVQWYGTTTADTSAAGKHYTIDYNTQTQEVESDGHYHIYHDLGNAFIGEFTTGDKFKLKEVIGVNNKYVYHPEFSVWDQANNDKNITFAGNNTDGFTFDFSPTTTVTGGLENTNIKARFDNYMEAHNLTLTKEFTNTVDTTTSFQVQIKFAFTNDANDQPDYVSYPLFYDLDGKRMQMGGDGIVTFTSGQIVKIIDIPENAKIQITEVLPDTVNGYRYDSTTLKLGNTAVDSEDITEVTKGIQFVMGNDDMSAVINNKTPDNKYTITYNYQSYGASPKTESLYGTQSYTVTGVFTTDELDTYLQLNPSTGAIEFQSVQLEKTFINNKAPYEKNFMQTLSFANSAISKTGSGFDSKGDYTGSVTATGTADYNINVFFNLPYAVITETVGDSGTDMVPQEYGETGKVAYSGGSTARGSKDITCFDWYVTDGMKNAHDETSETAAVYVNAPLILYEDTNSDGTLGDENDTVYYFQYWSVKSQSGYGKTSAEYTRCYDYEFNFALFTDSIIEPIYDTSWAQPASGGPTTYNNYDRYNPELQILDDEDKGISIAFLENSRNQYNNNGCGSRTVSTAAADVIYSDFLLSFNYDDNGLVQLNTLEQNVKKAGLVVEAVDYMDYEEGSTTNFDYDKNYSGVEKFTSSEENSSRAIIAWLQGGTQAPHCAKSQFDVKALDNKNCKQYYYALNNRSNSSGKLLNTMQNRYKVFRAYAYIGDVNEGNLTNVKLSAPVYFTIYDVGCQGLADNSLKPSDP